MTQLNTSFTFCCAEFVPTPGELDEHHEDYINPGVFAKEAASFLAKGLAGIGFEVVNDFPEDWGRWIEIENPEGYFLAVGVANFDEEGGITHRVFVEPVKSPIKKWFKKIDTEQRVMLLVSGVRRVLEADAKITEIRMENEQ